MRAPAAAPVAGAFAFPSTYNAGNPSRYPFATMTAGVGALVAGAGGAAVGRFGFAHVDGRVTNARTAARDRVGVVILPFVEPALNTWQRNYWDEASKSYRIREGTEVTCVVRGAIWMRFDGGAWAGQPVYASILDGRAFSGYAADAEPTVWTVQTPCEPGQLAIVTTTAFFT